MFSDMENRHFFHNAISFFKKETLIDRPLTRYWLEKKTDIGQEILLNQAVKLYTYLL